MTDDRFGGSNGVVFTNVRIIDGSGDSPYTGEVVVQGNRIRQVNRGSSRLTSGLGGVGGQTVIDGMGASLMPGLCDAHLHLSWNNAPGHRSDPDRCRPGGEHRLVAELRWPRWCSTPASRPAAAPRRPSRASTSSCANAGSTDGIESRTRAISPQVPRSRPWAASAIPEPSHIPHEGLNLGLVVSGPGRGAAHSAGRSSSMASNAIKLNLSGGGE